MNLINAVPFSDSLVAKIFNMDESDPIFLLEDENKYFIVELIKTENVEKNLNNQIVKDEVLKDLLTVSKRELISDLINKINNNKFDKVKFDKLSRDSNINIKKINLKNQNDEEAFKKKYCKRNLFTSAK